MALNFPDSPTLNQVYADSTSGFSYQWDGVVWKSYSPSSSNTIQGLDDISALFNNSTVSFPLSSGNPVYPISVQQLEINLGGVIQAPGVDYSISGSNIVFTTAPTSGLTFSGKILGVGIPVNYANDGNVYYRQVYAATAGQTSFTFTNTYTVGYLDVYQNGVRLSSGTDFSATTGTSFSLTVPAQLNDEIEAVGYRVASIVTTIGSFDNINVSGVVTAVGGFNIGIQSAGTTVTSGPVSTLNFVGTGNTFAVSGTRVDISISGGGGSIGTTGITTQTFFSNPNFINTQYTLNNPNHNYGMFGPVSIGATITVGAGNTFVIV